MKKFCCIKMTKIASSVFGESEQVKVFKCLIEFAIILLCKGLSKYISRKFIIYWNIIELKLDAINLVS